MPKRKAVEPVDSSDGEDDTYYSFTATPNQSPFPKLVSNNFNIAPSTQNTLVPASTSSSLFSFGGGGSKRSVLGRGPPSFGLNKPQGGIPMRSADTTLSNSNSGSGSSNQEFSKGMRDLNSAFLSTVRSTVSKNPSHSLLPLVKDYLFHSRVLLEHCKKGGAQAELVNGINPPQKSFKSLGEFFDDFEARYVANNQGDAKFDDALAGASSALTSRYYSPESNFKSNSNSTFSTASSQSNSVDNTKLTHPEPPSTKVKFSPSIPADSTNKLAMDRINSPRFFENPITSSPPLNATTSPSISTSPVKPTEPAVAKPATTAPFTGFSFFTPPAPSTSIALGSFPSTKAEPNSKPEDKNNDEEGGEDDEPPKVEVKEVKEDDALYSIRCKVFGLVAGAYKDKGIGMLYVKKLEDGKHQIVVRANNNLGTVILNILLQKTLPLEKSGKNGVLTVDLTEKPTKPVIIKVKTENDATELLEKLKEYQQSS